MDDKQKNDAQGSEETLAIGERPDLHGRSYINWLRCSTVGQADTSPDGQKKTNDHFAAIHKMRWAGHDLYAEGVSGSQTFNRQDIDRLIELKRTRKNFDVVIVYEYGRMTRGGIRHGNAVEERLAEAGITLVSSTELVPDGPIGELVKSMKHFANQAQAMNISASVARGLSLSLARNARPAASRAAHGLDREYVGPDGKPRAIIRWEGRDQVRYDPSTMTEVGRTKRPKRNKNRKPGEERVYVERKVVFRGYKKQADETVRLIPGHPDAVRAVQLINRLYHLEGMGIYRIATRLKELNIPGPHGGPWWTTTIQKTLDSPIYCGIEVRHRYTRGIYNKVGRNGAVPVKIDQSALARQKRSVMPTFEQPRSEWMLVDVPSLKDFLDPDVREAALKHIMKVHNEDSFVARKARRERRKHKYDDSGYVLTKILHNKGTGHYMRGETKICPSKKPNGGLLTYRMYVDGTTLGHGHMGAIGRKVRATELEDAVLNVVMSIFNDPDWVAERVKSAMQAATFEKPDEDGAKKRMLKERQEIVARLARIHRTSAHLSDEDLDALVREDNERLASIRHELDKLSTSEAKPRPTVNEAVEAVKARLACLPKDWRTIPNRELKRLLDTVIERLEIDLVDYSVELKLRLPCDLLNPITDSDHPKNGGVSGTTAWWCDIESPSLESLKIEDIQCKRHGTSHNQCFKCVRPSRRAA